MTGTESDIQWYIARDGKQHGPLSDVEMQTFVARGHLKPSDLIWRAGFADWRQAQSVFTNEMLGGAPTGAPAPAAHTAAGLHRSAAAPAQTGFEPARSERMSDRPSPESLRQYIDPQVQNVEANEWQEPRETGGIRRVAIAAVLLAMLGGAGWFAFEHRDSILQFAVTEKKAADETAVETAAKAPVEAPAKAPEPEKAKPGFDANEKALDARLQQMELWSFVKKEFPEWYLERLSTAAQLVAANKSDAEVAKNLVEGLVALRRQHAEQALAASAEKLRLVASAFLDNLKKLKEYSTDACYSFISQGELSPVVIELLQKPENSVHIQAQVAAIFRAIADGRKSPTTHSRPNKSDYDTLVAELAKLGWNQNDLQLFSDPKALAKSPPDRVCQMVQDWFVAHLAVADQGTQERLLIETLRPVVSG